MESDESADEIASLCVSHFRSFPPRFRPSGSGSRLEWTLLAALVAYPAQLQPPMETTSSPTLPLKQKSCAWENAAVISMGSGSKCLGGDKITSDGLILNDSHAEILAKRGFQR
jgi:tRNA-specific adenosine deaminase 1